VALSFWLIWINYPLFNQAVRGKVIFARVSLLRRLQKPAFARSGVRVWRKRSLGPCLAYSSIS